MISTAYLMQDGIEVEIETIKRAASGDRIAMHTLVTAHSSKIYAVAFRMLSSAQDAEDVTQDAFLRLWKILPKWQPDAKLSTWLHRVTLNLCYDRLRKKKPVLFESPPEQIDQGLRPDQSLQQSQTGQIVSEAISRLAPRQRAAITLTGLQGHSNKDAANMMDIKLAALESLLARARRALKADLAELKENL